MKEATQIKVYDSWFPKTGDDKDKIDKSRTNNGNLQDVILNKLDLGYTSDKDDLVTSNNNYISDKFNFQTNELSIGKEPNDMDNNDIILKLIEKVEQSNQQVKTDLNDSEKRITEDRRESEKRITEERRLSEERMEKNFTEAMSSFKQLSTKMDINNTQLSAKIDTNIKELSNKIDATTKELNNKTDTNTKDLYDKIDKNNKYINNISVSIIIGVGAIAVALIVALFAFMYTTNKQYSIPKAATFNYTIINKNI